MSSFILSLFSAIIIIIVLFICLWFFIGKETNKKQKDIILKKEENQKKFNYLKQKFGQTTKIINYALCKFILISDSRNLIMINDNIYNFKDILTFEVKDNSTTIFSSTSKTSTNTGSMLGRAVVGGVLSGGVGSVIGGCTASKSTQTEGNSSTIHDYSILITLNNLSTPIINLYIGKNGKIVSEITALLNIIQKRNSSDFIQKTLSDIDCTEFKEFYEYLPDYISEDLEQKAYLELEKLNKYKDSTAFKFFTNTLTKAGMPIEEVTDFISWNK